MTPTPYPTFTHRSQSPVPPVISVSPLSTSSSSITSSQASPFLSSSSRKPIMCKFSPLQKDGLSQPQSPSKPSSKPSRGTSIGSNNDMKRALPSSLPKNNSGDRLRQTSNGKLRNQLQQLPLLSSRNVSPFSSPFSSSTTLSRKTSAGSSNTSGENLHSHHHHNQQQALLVNRSGKEAVKEHLAYINSVCDQQEERSALGNPALKPPIEKCTALSYWSTDAYYAIVMYKNGGIDTVIRVMKAFLEVSDSDVEDFVATGRRKHKVHSNASRFQSCCARTLLGLCQTSERLKKSVVEAGGRGIVVAAMQKYPRSFDVEAFADLLEDKEEKEVAKERNEKKTEKTEEKTLAAKQLQQVLDNKEGNLIAT